MNLKEYDFTSLVKECKEIREKIQYKDCCRRVHI